MTDKQFTYWQKPWLKWVFLVLGILQGFMLYEKIRDYQMVIGSEIFSSEQLIRYMGQQKFSCLITVILFLGFTGIFLIGTLARNRRSAELAEALLLSGMGVMMITGIMIWGRTLARSGLVIWICVSLLMVGAGLFSLFRKAFRK